MPDDVKEMLGLPISVSEDKKRSKSEPRSPHKMKIKVNICKSRSSIVKVATNKENYFMFYKLIKCISQSF